VNNSEYLTALAYAYLGEVIAFTICQAMLLRQGQRVHIYLWMIASGLSVLSIIGAPNLRTVFSTERLEIWAAVASLAGGVFRYGALSFRTKSFIRDRLSTVLVIASVVGMPLALLPALIDYRLLITSFIGVAISVAAFRAVLRNRYWINQNDYGRNLMLAGMGIAVFAMGFRGFTAYPFGEDRVFAGVSGLQVFGLESLVVISLFLQMGFTGMLIARHDKMRKFLDRRNVRAWQRANLLAERGRNLRIIAKRRLDLIQLLTHEVRQPINNAQASLQSITPDLDKASSISDRASHALDRAKSALDGITRALSNVIVAGALVGDGQNWSKQQLGAMEILEMARLDCNSANQRRIVLAPQDGHIFIECVPTHVRVALHNLLEHALSLADVGENISVSVAVDDVNLGVAFTISGNMNQQKMDKTDMLEGLGVTDKASPQMTSYGLFVANLVAQNHQGDCSIETVSPDITKIIFFVQQ